MPEEIMIVAIVAITCGTALSIVKMLLDYRQKGGGSPTRTGASSMTTSELETMLERAVARATEPLVDRMELLEAQLATPQLPAGGERIDLEAVSEGEMEPAMATRSRTR